MIIQILFERDSYFNLPENFVAELAGLPLDQMIAFVRRNGSPTTIENTNDIDIWLTYSKLYDDREEAELREEIRKGGMSGLPESV